jgi:hypothetical protein
MHYRIDFSYHFRYYFCSVASRTLSRMFLMSRGLISNTNTTCRGLPTGEARYVGHQDFNKTPIGTETMENMLLNRPTTVISRIPGASFGDAPVTARLLDPGMGMAVARRTVFRPEDQECFGRVADRVSEGNMSLLSIHGEAEILEQKRLRNAIATGSLLTSGRHLQHGDAQQKTRNLELFTNCATAIASFIKFYLLLNGSGVGRSYDDSLMAVEWANAPNLRLYLSPEHKDYPKDRETKFRFATEFGLLNWGTNIDAFDQEGERLVAEFIDQEFYQDKPLATDTVIRKVEDSREGWAKTLETVEAMAFSGSRNREIFLDFSFVRPYGSPIGGMQNRPASGPLSLMRGFINLRRYVIEVARACLFTDSPLEKWEQAMLVDHYFSSEVQVGGARRAARMATKNWKDPGALRFVRIKSEGGLWTANNSLMVDAEFWNRVKEGNACIATGLTPEEMQPLTAHALLLFNEATRLAYVNGEPGFINGDKLEDHRTGDAWRRPVTDGNFFGSARYRLSEGNDLLLEMSRRASSTDFPVTTNPCGEIVLHVTGGYCVIADYAPVLACPVSFDEIYPGLLPSALAAEWDARVEDSVRLGVRFLIRANLMDALYSREVKLTNRIGIGPTGLHEWAWLRFGLAFADLLDERVSGEFWALVAHMSAVAKEESILYSAELGLQAPVTVPTVKPSGTMSKMFLLTEGGHLLSMRQFLRWVQFRGTRDSFTGLWTTGSDPLLAEFEARGYPIRELQSFPGMTIVGFPTKPLLTRLGVGDRLVTAPEATPQNHYDWLKLLERHWLGVERGNQVSYTLKVFTDDHDINSFRQIVINNQPHIRCCAIMPSKSNDKLGYEYLPEEEVTNERFVEIMNKINDPDLLEAIDMVHLQCAGGACPI